VQVVELAIGRKHTVSSRYAILHEVDAINDEVIDDTFLYLKLPSLREGFGFCAHFFVRKFFGRYGCGGKQRVARVSPLQWVIVHQLDVSCDCGWVNTRQ
jgi:hypothetical protein